MNLDTVNLAIWVLSNSLLLLIATTKLLFFLRTNNTYVLLVFLLFQTISDIGPFIMFFFIFIVLLSLLYRIAGIIVPDADVDYKDINSYVIYLFHIFRNAIGDEKTPNIDFWSARGVEAPFLHRIMVGWSWFLWIICVIANLVILLNFIIAIISQSYDSVMTQASKIIYEGRSDVNFEVCLIVEAVGQFKDWWNEKTG